MHSISNGCHFEKRDLNFEKHGLVQWRCIQMAGILKSMAWCNGGAFKWLPF
jgi:hypothetical protein